MLLFNLLGRLLLTTPYTNSFCWYSSFVVLRLHSFVKRRLLVGLCEHVLIRFVVVLVKLVSIVRLVCGDPTGILILLLNWLLVHCGNICTSL